MATDNNTLTRPTFRNPKSAALCSSFEATPVSKLLIMATDNNTLTRPTFSTPQSEIRNPFEGHELWAACYDEFPNPLLHLEERCLTQILPDLGCSSIADVGCGTGRWLRRWVTQRPKLCIGVDFSPAMLRRAQAEARLRGHLISTRQLRNLDGNALSGLLTRLSRFVADLDPSKKSRTASILTSLKLPPRPSGLVILNARCLSKPES
jgi:SAM-dependent methyltransferase